LSHRLQQLHPASQIAQHQKQLAEILPRLDAAMRRIIDQRDKQLSEIRPRQDAAIRKLLERRHRELGRLGGQMHALSPLAVLDRGYATVMKEGQIIRDPAQVESGDTLDVQLARGALQVVVKR
ncbi:MAG TPA: exodeoxyribonuclease VII large subunit, partial [Kofleriaceae bacterium]